MVTLTLEVNGNVMIETEIESVDEVAAKSTRWKYLMKIRDKDNYIIYITHKNQINGNDQIGNQTQMDGIRSVLL